VPSGSLFSAVAEVRRPRTVGGMTDDTKPMGTGNAIILVVDRDPHIRELEAHFLSQAGYSVVFEQNGPGALEQTQKVGPDIVITEILVPMLDGLALCRRIKADPATRDTAVLIFSILSAGARAREAGADAFLLKPLAEHALIHTVQQLLEARSSRLTRTQT